MKNEDFERAKGALVQTLQVAGPILAALQQASTVFDFMTNATVHQKALTREVEDLKKQVDTASGRLQSLASQIGERETQLSLAEAAHAAALLQIEEAAQRAKEDAEAAVSDHVAAVQVEATAKLQQAAEYVASSTAAGEDALQQLELRRTAAEAEVAALEKKLGALKANAARFAASLAE